MSELNDPFPLMPEKTFVDFNENPPANTTRIKSTPPNNLKSVKDLIDVLGNLQTRVDRLEEENDILRAALKDRVTKKETVQLLSRLDGLRLPKAAIFSDSFLMRAFSIYGHWFVANIMISIVMTIIFFIVFSILGVSLFNSLGQIPTY